MAARPRSKTLPKMGQLSVGGSRLPTTRTLPGTRVIDQRWAKSAVLRHLHDFDVFTVVLACKRTGVSPQTFYKWKAEDATFAKDVEQAMEDITQRLENKAQEFAVGIGVEAPVPSLMMFMLKSKRPDVYRDPIEGKFDMTTPGGATMSFSLSLGDRGGTQV